MKKGLLIILGILSAILISGCGADTYTGEIPTLEFSKVTHTPDGKPCFYLFDDNPEYLNKNFLADGDIPSSIAHFDDLGEGVYTVFSYHHRGTAAESQEDLFFDLLFSADSGAKYKITKIGLDHNWQWNKAWADFTGTDVYLPEYLNTYNCTCQNGRCFEDDGICDGECDCIVKNQLVKADSGHYQGLNELQNISNGYQLLSEIIPTIDKERINEIRHGGTVEPIWLIMEFEILSGSLDVSTMAYRDKEKAKENFGAMEKGYLDDEPQYKGRSENAPIVETELSYTFDNSTKSGFLPIRIINQRYPDGYIAKDGAFGTNVNTWKNKEILIAESAESDMLCFTYQDKKKLSYYGENTDKGSDLWTFDPYHTSLYKEDKNPDFRPNITMAEVDYPKGGENISPGFYEDYVLNLGNYGVRYLYTINLTNNSDRKITFNFSLNSVSGQVYRYSLYKGEELVCDDGGRYIMKKFDMDPAEDPKSKAEPKERLKPAKYTTTQRFELEPENEYVLKFETVVLTGCDAPMTNIFSVECE